MEPQIGDGFMVDVFPEGFCFLDADDIGRIGL